MSSKVSDARLDELIELLPHIADSLDFSSEETINDAVAHLRAYRALRSQPDGVPREPLLAALEVCRIDYQWLADNPDGRLTTEYATKQAALLAALAEKPADREGVPEGYVLVPRADVRAIELYERTKIAQGFVNAPPWDVLADETRQLYREEAVRKARLRDADTVRVPREPTREWMLRYKKAMRLNNDENAWRHLRAMLDAAEQSPKGGI